MNCEAVLKLKSGNVLTQFGTIGLQRVNYFMLKSAIYLDT